MVSGNEEKLADWLKKQAEVIEGRRGQLFLDGGSKRHEEGRRPIFFYYFSSTE